MSGSDLTRTSDLVDAALRRGMHAEPLPAAALARIRAAAESEWRATTGAAAHERRWLRYASAAAVAMLLLAGGWTIGTRNPAGARTAAIGRFEHIDYPGAVEQHRWLRDRALADGEPVHSGQRILVRGGGRIALASAGSLRLAAGTDIQVDSVEQLRLTDGDLYVDIHPSAAPACILRS